MIDEDGIAFDGAWVGGAQAFRVGVHALDFFFDGLGIVGEIDGIAERLAHLVLSVRADEQWEHRR